MFGEKFAESISGVACLYERQTFKRGDFTAVLTSLETVCHDLTLGDLLISLRPFPIKFWRWKIMPIYGSTRDADWWKRRDEFKQRESQKLIAKGLVKNSQKFNDILRRKMARIFY